MARPSRDTVFIRIAEEFGSRSTCPRGHVGAIVVQNDRIISHGYNGAGPGQPQCDEVGCDVLQVWEVPKDEEVVEPIQRGRVTVQESLLTEPAYGVAWRVEPTVLGCQRAIHAEQNAISYAARVGVSCEGARMYTTHEPCRKCAEAILVAGIIEVFYYKPYRLGAAKFLNDADVFTLRMS
jgi:dCMP deaminase